MRPAIAIATIVLLASAAGAALAKDTEPDARYQLEKTDDGYVRMDKRTGAMSICNEHSGQLVCKVAADERSAYNDQMDALAGRIEKLESRVSALEGTSAGDDQSQSSDREFDKSVTIIKRVFQHFVDIVKDLNDELRRDDAVKPDPSQT